MFLSVEKNPPTILKKLWSTGWPPRAGEKKNEIAGKVSTAEDALHPSRPKKKYKPDIRLGKGGYTRRPKKEVS